MAEAVGAVRIDLFANLAEWVSGLDKAEGRLNRFAKSTERMSKGIIASGQKLTVGLTAPIVAFAGLSIKAAAEAQDLQGAFNISFGSMAEDATQWAIKTGDAMGRSTQTIQKTAIGFQQLFEDIAPTEQAAAELSMRFTELSEDYASFANVSSDQAFQVLSGGLAGAGKALKRLGIDISDGALKQKAMQLGIASANVELTNQQKVLARAQIIMDGFAKQTGEIARSQGEAEEDTRRTREEFNELLVTVGNDLLPIFNELLKNIRAIVQGFNGMDKQTRATIGTVAALAAAAGPVVLVLGNVVKLGGIAAKTFGTLGLAFLGAGKSANTFGGSLLTMATRLTSVTALAYAAGAALGAMFAPDLDTHRALAELMVRNLQKVGLTAYEARQAVKFYYAELAAGRKPTEDAILAAGRLAGEMAKLGVGSGIVGMTMGLQDLNKQGAASAKGLADMIKGFGDLGGTVKDTKDNFDSLRTVVDPIGEGFKKYQADLATAIKLGYDAATAQRMLGTAFIDSVQDVTGFRDALASLSPELQAIVARRDAITKGIAQWKAMSDAKQLADDALTQSTADQAAATADAIQNLYDYGQALTDQFDPAARLRNGLSQIDAAFRAGAISADVYAKARAAAFAETPEGQKQVKFVDDLSNAFTDAATGAGNLGDAIKQMLLDSLRTEMIKPFFDNLFSGLFPNTQAITQGAAGGGFNFGSIVSGIGSFLGFGGTRDKGGDGKAGMTYKVGSGVQEWFTPKTDGTFSRQPPDGGGMVMNVYTRDADSFRQSGRQVRRAARRAIEG